MHGDLDDIVELINNSAPPGRALVAIDGIGGSGKSVLADTVADRIAQRPVHILHVDDFFNPDARRHSRGRYSAEGFWLDTYDYDSLISSALEPLLRGAPTYLSGSFDRTTGDSARPAPTPAPADAIFIVEGTFLHRDELTSFWHYSLFLDIEFDESARRMQQRRNGAGLDKLLIARYHGAQRLYFQAARPWARASLVVNNSDFQHPRVIDPGSGFAARLSQSSSYGRGASRSRRSSDPGL